MIQCEVIGARRKRGLVVIAFAIEGHALNLLLTNKARGVMPTLAINAPGVGDDRFEILQDLAVLTGAKLVAEEAGDRLDRPAPPRPTPGGWR